MFEFDFGYLLFIVLSTLSAFFIVKFFAKDFYVKSILFIFTIGFTFYSGIGISIEGVDKSYIISFLSFYAAFCVMLLLSLGKSSSKIITDSSMGTLDTVVLQNWSILRIFAFAYLISLVFQLVYPQFHLFDLFKPWEVFSNSQDSQVFQMRILRNNDSVYSFAGNVAVLCRPFYLIQLFLYRKKPLRFILWLLVPFYIQMVSRGDFARDIIVFPIVMILLFLYTEKYIKKKTMILLVGGLIILGGPLLNFIYYLRKGMGEYNFDLMGGLINLLNQEATYPYYYEFCNNLSTFLHAKDLIIWILTLPIHFLYKPENSPMVLQIYTFARLNMNYGDPGYYIVLPSWLGEAIMFYGKDLCWIQGAFSGMIIGLVVRFFKKHSILKFWFIYIVVDLLRYLRSVSQEYFAQTINSSILFFVVIFLLLAIYKIKRGTYNEGGGSKINNENRTNASVSYKN